jgi:hypothetical protein
MRLAEHRLLQRLPLADAILRRGCVLRLGGLAELFCLGGALSAFLQLALCEELTE